MSFSKSEEVDGSHNMSDRSLVKNGFFNYLRDLCQSNSALSWSEIAREGARSWKHLSEEEKSRYQIMSSTDTDIVALQKNNEMCNHRMGRMGGGMKGKSCAKPRKACDPFFLTASIDSDGPVNTFYYIPLVYEESVAVGSQRRWHEVLRSTIWQFFEVLFRQHLALLLPFNLALLVPRCNLAFISFLVLVSNFLMFVCFTSAICQLVVTHGHAHSLRLLTILALGPACQVLVVCRLLGRLWLSRWIVV